MVRKYQSFFNRMLMLIDASVVIVAFISAWVVKFKTGILPVAGEKIPLQEYLPTLWVLIPLYIILNYFFKLYTSRRGRSFTSEMAAIINVNLMALLLVMAGLYVLNLDGYSRAVILLFTGLAITLSVLERYLFRRFLRYIRKKGFNKRFILIIGAGSLGTNFLEKVKVNAEYGYEVLGFLDDDREKQGQNLNGLPVLGTIDELCRIVNKIHIDEVVIALPLGAYDRLKFIVAACEKLGLKASIIPDYVHVIPARPQVEDFNGVTLINIRHVPLDEMPNYILKRAFDIVVSSLLIAMTSPVLIAIVIGIKLTSPGPILFKQERVGLHRRLFNMYKFRSMHVATNEVASTTWTTENDPRKTKFGAFLRKTSLDELPQFFNVLKGDMSLIGPRPERPFFVDKFKEEIPKYMIKHHVQPGITGWAQVNGLRGDTSIEERIKHDIYYIENWHFLLDIKIFYLTILKGFINRNAY